MLCLNYFGVIGGKKVLCHQRVLEGNHAKSRDKSRDDAKGGAQPKEHSKIAAQRLHHIESATMSQPDTPDVTGQEQAPASIMAAAHAYQVAMQQQSASPAAAATTPAPLAPVLDSAKDIVMTEATPDRPAVSRCACLYEMLSFDHHVVASNPSRRNQCPKSSSSKDWYPFAQHERQRCHFSGYVSAPRSCAYDSKRGTSSWCTNETISE